MVDCTDTASNSLMLAKMASTNKMGTVQNSATLLLEKGSTSSCPHAPRSLTTSAEVANWSAINVEGNGKVLSAYLLATINVEEQRV
eukprot:CAMPEP_0119388398 /NCGR_PEP_ID=MMETSP1334-20130426/104764_1 /TAXON_ID=127549 /ORGANISM="Calcidiscus leptoporus, Strain RCC1130" /LENGTH=85 /DNA_ID=CAMNT_0007410365 /DNA_START=86 /DNA_END=343 /DNA_ORIENTATION=+